MKRGQLRAGHLGACAEGPAEAAEFLDVAAVRRVADGRCVDHRLTVDVRDGGSATVHEDHGAQPVVVDDLPLPDHEVGDVTIGARAHDGLGSAAWCRHLERDGVLGAGAHAARGVAGAPVVGGDGGVAVALLRDDAVDAAEREGLADRVRPVATAGGTVVELAPHGARRQVALAGGADARVAGVGAGAGVAVVADALTRLADVRDALVASGAALAVRVLARLAGALTGAERAARAVAVRAAGRGERDDALLLGGVTEQVALALAAAVAGVPEGAGRVHLARVRIGRGGAVSSSADLGLALRVVVALHTFRAVAARLADLGVRARHRRAEPPLDVLRVADAHETGRTVGVGLAEPGADAAALLTHQAAGVAVADLHEIGLGAGQLGRGVARRLVAAGGLVGGALGRVVAGEAPEVEATAEGGREDDEEGRVARHAGELVEDLHALFLSVLKALVDRETWLDKSPSQK